MLKSIEASETGIVTLAETGEELLGGTVAQVLELMSAGLATLALPPPEVCHGPTLSTTQRPNMLIFMRACSTQGVMHDNYLAYQCAINKTAL